MAAKSALYNKEEPRSKSEAKEVALCHERISIAKKAQEGWAEDSGAKRFVKQYKGDYGIVFHTRNKQVKVPPINEVFAYVQSDISTTYNRDPYITVNAEAGTPKGAALWEVQLNYWWRKLKIKEELEYEIIDKDLVGYSWHKVGDAVDSIGSGDQLKIESEKLYSKFLGWNDVVWNIGSKRPPVDCEWMAQRIVMPLEDVKKKFKAAKGLEGSRNPEVDEDTYKKSAYKDDIKVAVLWEFWDARNRKIKLLAEGLEDRYLEEPRDWPEYQTEFPFLMYWDFAVPCSPRPMSAIAPWEPQILEEMVIMGQAINHAKRWNRQAFVKGGDIDDNALDKFERGDDGAIIKVNADLKEGLRFADFGQLPTDFYLLMDRLQAIKRNINGQPEFVRGGVTKTNTRTIGELQLMQQGTKGRQDRKIDRLETHLENISRHMMMHLKANFDFEETLKITGDTPDEVIKALGSNYDPETGQVTFTPDDINGEYDVDVKAGSTLPLDKQTRVQVLELVLTTVAQAVSQGPMSPFMNVLIQQLLEDYDIKGLQEAYELEVQMVERAKAEAQNQQSIEDQKVMAEAEKRKAQASQITVETEITAQDAAIGPMGRALAKKMEKPDPKPAVSGSSR
jgi:hypothetical protein